MSSEPLGSIEKAPMLLRTLLTMVNLATIAVAIVVLFTFPQYAGVAFYILLGWMVGSLVLVYGPWANRQVLRPRSSGAPGTSPPAARARTGPLASELGFCIYCAAPLAPGVATCPACGHASPSF
ncbi:MAG: hypothetical protein L3K02_06070 [Thermoplasmata archaeon]|nr:hypothetical protein [Thermoplasmata archaeon]